MNHRLVRVGAPKPPSKSLPPAPKQQQQPSTKPPSRKRVRPVARVQYEHPPMFEADQNGGYPEWPHRHSRKRTEAAASQARRLPGAALGATSGGLVVQQPPSRVFIRCPSCKRSDLTPPADSHWCWRFPADLHRAVQQRPLAAQERKGPFMRCPSCKTLLHVPLQGIYNARQQWFRLLFKADVDLQAYYNSQHSSRRQQQSTTGYGGYGSGGASTYSNDSGYGGNRRPSAAVRLGPTLKPVRRSGSVVQAPGDWLECAICGENDDAHRLRSFGGQSPAPNGREAPRPGNMVMCDGFDGLCNLSVHPRCYGLAAMPLSSWSCNACSQGILPYDTQLRDRTLRVIRACTTPLLGQ